MERRGPPAEEPSSPRRDALLVLAIAALAFALRLVHLHQARAVPLFDAVIMDGRSYSEWADRIVAGDWVGDAIFYQAPLYPYFLAVVKLAVGDDLWRIRLVQIALGSLSCSLLFLAGRLWFSRAAGAAAGLLLAVYPPAIFFDGLIQKAGLGLAWTALLLAATGFAARRPRARRFAAVGVALGLLALTREETILLVPVVAAWAWLGFRERGAKERPRRLAAYAAGLALVLLPVGFRNLAVGGEFVLTTSQAGPNFYIGNHAGATGTYAPLRPGRQNTAYERKDAVELAEQALGRELSPKEVSGYWRDRALAFIRSEPLAWLALLGRKVDLLLNAYEMPDYEDQYFYQRRCTLLAALDRVWHFGVLVPLGAAGIALTWRRRRGIALLHALLATTAVAVVLFYVFARYRYPLVPILLLFAGAGIVEAWGAVRSRRARALLPAAIALVATAWFSNRTLFEEDAQLAASLNNAAGVLAGKGRDADAVALYEESLRIAPGSAEVLGNLGVSRMRLGRADDAIDAFRRVAELRPDDWKALVRLGSALLQVGRVAEGGAAIERAIAVDRRAVLEAAQLMMRQTGGRDLVAIDVLASAQGAGGDLDGAIATASAADAIPAAPAQDALRARIRERLERHRRQKAGGGTGG